MSAARARRARATALSLQLRRAVRSWAPSRRELTRWASTALGARAGGRELGVAVVGAAESRRLNARYRGRDSRHQRAVLPGARTRARRASGAARGPGRSARRCCAARRAPRRSHCSAHWAHLVVHGALHLIGYDHERDADARRMERREVAVLRRLGFPNPYRSP